MANPEHLAILKQGVQSGKVEERASEVKPDFTPGVPWIPITIGEFPLVGGECGEVPAQRGH